MTYEEMIVALVGLQYDTMNTDKAMDIHILPLFTRVDIRDKEVKSVRTIIIERTSNFADLLLEVIWELKHKANNKL